MQPTEQPNQKNNWQRNPEKPKQQSASHDVYSYFQLHKLNATTTLQLNRSDYGRPHIRAVFERGPFLAHSTSETTGTNADPKRYGPGKLVGQYALPFMPLGN